LALYWKFERYILILVLGVTVAVHDAKSQDTVRVDTLKTKGLKIDNIQADTSSSKIVLKHSPQKAALLSAVFPGLGQIYNKKYWKLPFVYGGFGVSAFYFIRNQRWYRDYLEGYVIYSNTNDPALVQHLDKIRKYPGREAEALKFYVDTYRSWRDWSIIALAGTYVLSIIDATVDAYLFDYNIRDNLSLKVEPVLINTVTYKSTIGLKFSFNLH
jgi:hypothetical protein